MKTCNLDAWQPKEGSVVGIVHNLEDSDIGSCNLAFDHHIVVLDNPSFEATIRVKDLNPRGILITGTGDLSHGFLRFSDLGIPVAQVGKMPIDNGVALRIDFTQGVLTITEDKCVLERADANKKITGGRLFPETLSTTDGETFQIYFTGNTPYMIKKGLAYGLKTIGLVRTEYVVSGHHTPPEEEELYEGLKELLENNKPNRAYVRLVDYGGDKCPAWLSRVVGANVPMGVRGSRVYYTETGSLVLRAQLKAIDALIDDGFSLAVMAPFINDRMDITNIVRHIQENCRNEITIIPFAETPSACMNVREFIGLTDSVFLGTNDIMQHFYGANREFAEVARYLSPYTPGLFRMLKQLLLDSRSANIRPVVCGQLSTRKGVAKVLFGMGYRTFVTSPDQASVVYDDLSSCSSQECHDLANEILHLDDRRQVADLIGAIV